jgi:chromosome partitioning protein
MSAAFIAADQSTLFLFRKGVNDNSRVKQLMAEALTHKIGVMLTLFTKQLYCVGEQGEISTMLQTELVGVAEIAAMANVTKQAVSNWQHRHDNFPKPIQRLQTGPVWDKEHVARWIKNYKGEPTHIVSFINLKGGVGKTTICTAVAEMLAKEKNKHVLVIDLDPQTNATVSLIPEEKWEEVDDKGQTLAQLFSDRLNGDTPPTFNIHDAIVRGVSAVDGGIQRLELLPSSIRLIDIQEKIPLIALTGNYAMSPLDILKNAVAGVIDRYDYVLIDCPPSLGTITKNGLRISSAYVIPTIPDIVSTWGIYQIVDAVVRFGEDTGHAVKPLGIIASKVRGTALHKRIMEDLRQGRLGRFGRQGSGVQLPTLFDAYVSEAASVARGADVEGGINTLRQKYGQEPYRALLRLTEEIQEKCLQTTS